MLRRGVNHPSTATLSGRSCVAASAAVAAVRCYNAAYGQTGRTHQGVVAAFCTEDAAADATLQQLRCRDGTEFIERAMPLLDQVESRLAQWRLAKWEMRLPAVVRPEYRETAKRQLDHVRGLVMDRLEKRAGEVRDLHSIAAVLGEPDAEALRGKTRAWVKERVADLRWKGDIEGARTVREAWARMEGHGGSHANVLGRLCYVYCLARLGTFDNAFANTIVPIGPADAVSPPLPLQRKPEVPQRQPLFQSLQRSGSVAVDECNPMKTLVQLTLVNVPSVPILHDFLGLNMTDVVHEGYSAGPGGYREALGAFMTSALREQLASRPGCKLSAASAAATRDPGVEDESSVVTKEGHRVPRAFASVANAVPTAPNSLLRVSGVNANGLTIALFDYRLAKHAPQFPAPPCDFALVRGGEVTLISIAHPNRYLREAQIIGKTQAEGIARRAGMLLGQVDIAAEGKCRQLLLPPSYMDRKNLLRIATILGVEGDAPVAANTEVATHSAEMDSLLHNVPADCRGWVRHYDKELSPSDVDYAAQSKKVNAEDWYRL